MMTSTFPLVETWVIATLIAQWGANVAGSIGILDSYAKNWIAQVNWGTVYSRT